MPFYKSKIFFLVLLFLFLPLVVVYSMNLKNIEYINKIVNILSDLKISGKISSDDYMNVKITADLDIAKYNKDNKDMMYSSIIILIGLGFYLFKK